jgi:serine/threonine-protein kinase
MATVYLAHDLRHDRKVAIKVLHPELAAILGGDRFLNEIRVTAHLQHPHILALYDSGSAGHLLYYVMPFVEGESLRQHLVRQRQLTIPDAVRLAAEVAEALDYAHRHGVIHRDIKPENILLQEGRAMVADFGIALAVRNAGGERITQTGLSLGTPQYMSPEQATAERELDARSDVYSLGCVLYEMLTGEPPHTGATTHAVIAKIVTDRPTPVNRLRDTVTPELAATVHKALAKLPADRFSSAAEFAAALAQPVTTPATPRMTADVTTRTGRRTAWAVGGGIALLAVALGWTLGQRKAPPPVATTSQLTITAPDLTAAALTPDGTAIVYVSRATGSGWVKVRRLDQLEPVTLSGSPFLYGPTVSPDGRWLAARTLSGDPVLVPLGGGTTLQVAQGRAYFAWHRDGSLWLTRSPYQALERFVPGRDSLELIRDKLPGRVWLQQILDDGRTGLVVEVAPGSGSGPASAIDLRTGALTPLLQGPVIQVRYSSGYLVFANLDGSLHAAPFDPGAVRLTGPSVEFVQEGAVNGPGDALFDVASNGTLVYGPNEPESLVLVDRNGVARLASEEDRNWHAPQFSPDGRRVAIDVISSGGRDVWVLDLEQRTLARATFDADGHDPTWMPDGRRITYTTFRTGVFGIFRVLVGGSGSATPESLVTSPSLNHTGHWLPDTSALVVVATDL